MTAFVIELGLYSGEGEFKRWESNGFYAGYTDKGPIVAPDVTSAYRFPTRDHAANLPAGDERLRNSRILSVEGAPSA